MIVLLLLYVLVMVIAALAAVAGWRNRRRAPIFGLLVWLSLGAGGWAACDLVLLLTPSQGTALLAGSVLALVQTMLPAGFFCLAASVSNRAWRVSRRGMALLAAEPAILAAVLIGDPWHRLFYSGTIPAGFDGRPALQLGPLYWANTVYQWALLVVALVIVGYARQRAPHGGRRIYDWTLATAIPPVVLHATTVFFGAWSTDVTAAGMIISVVVAYFMVANPLLPTEIPVARQQVFDLLADGVVVADLSGRVLDHNPAAGRLIELIDPGRTDRLIGSELTEVFGDCLPAEGHAGTSSHTLIDVGGSGIDLQLRISALTDRRGAGIGWALATQDITEANRLRRQVEQVNTLLREQALRDPLTGLYNRRFLMTALSEALARAAESGEPLSLALIDIDFFKRVNDTYGHAAGDRVLVRTARLLTEHVRGEDIVARYGGEELVVLLPGTSADSARGRMERLRRILADSPTDVGGARINITVSVGTATTVGDCDAAHLLEEADRALYVAKQRGRNRVRQAASTHPTER